MSPAHDGGKHRFIRFPRSRGDEPQMATNLVADLSFSPLTRG